MSEGEQSLSGVREEAEEGLVDEQPQEQQEEQDPVINETATETTERIFNELKEKNARETDPEGEKLTKEPEPKEATKEVNKQDEFIEPPQGWQGEAKNAFNKIPKQLKQEIVRRDKESQAYLTKVTQEAAQAKQKAETVVRSANDYLMSQPDLIEAGYSPESLVNSLVGAHARLTNPNTSRAAYLDLGRQLGFDVSALESEGQQPQQVNIQQSPEYQGLLKEIEPLKSYVSNIQQQQYQAGVNSIADQLRSVQNEKDAYGNFVYPELHDAAFIDKVKPLVTHLARTMPYGQALKNAYIATTGKVPGNSSQQPTGTGLPKQQQSRATSAAVSVRGKSPAPQISFNAKDLPPEAYQGSAVDSARWALEQLRKR